MIVPNCHRSRLAELDDQELGELSRYTDYSVRVQERVLRPEGYNIGMNLGRAAGAGIDDHLHIHVVPRWVGDTNFMPVLGDVKVIPEHLQATYRRLNDGFAAVLRAAAVAPPRGTRGEPSRDSWPSRRAPPPPAVTGPARRPRRPHTATRGCPGC